MCDIYLSVCFVPQLVTAWGWGGVMGGGRGSFLRVSSLRKWWVVPEIIVPQGFAPQTVTPRGWGGVMGGGPGVVPQGVIPQEVVGRPSDHRPSGVRPSGGHP